ncbi:MAG: TRAP transporter TatT component family protein [Polyangiaceae bacterium]
MRLPSLSLALPVVAALALGSTGCIKSTLTNGQISATREASAAFDTIGDYELARSAAQSGLVQFEGMHVLAPDNTDALFMLTKGWVGYGFGFVEDEMEVAEDAGDTDLADYHRKRARMAYDRAVFYGLQLLAHQADGFDAVKKNELTLAKWLSDNFTSADDAPELFWTGYGWLARVNLMKGDDTEGPAFVADLYIGVAMLERAVALDPSNEHYSGLIALAAYHARTGMAEMDQAKQMLDAALAKTGGANLMVQLNYATKYACMKGDAALYQDMINKVLAAPDPDPHQRLTNAIAKRRAKRWLGRRRVKDACGIDLPPAK